MWELRLILILIGAVIVAGVYLWSRQNRRSAAQGAPANRRRAPVVDEAGFPPVAEAGVAAEPVLAASPDQPAEPGQLILVLYVAARDPVAGFDGATVLAACEGLGLRRGPRQIYYRALRQDPQVAVFSVADMMEPGTLDPERVSATRLQGLTLFLVLPGAQKGVDAYADMLATARHLAQRLDGEVLDETRSTLTRQTAHHIRERIIEFQRRNQIGQSD